jgi:hypothetical protein
MARRISVFLDDDVLRSLNEHTQVSPLSRSEIVAVAVRRFLRDERRRAPLPVASAHLARRIAVGDLPSRRVDGRRISRGAPWSN